MAVRKVDNKSINMPIYQQRNIMRPTESPVEQPTTPTQQNNVTISANLSAQQINLLQLIKTTQTDISSLQQEISTLQNFKQYIERNPNITREDVMSLKISEEARNELARALDGGGVETLRRRLEEILKETQERELKERRKAKELTVQLENLNAMESVRQIQTPQEALSTAQNLQQQIQQTKTPETFINKDIITRIVV